MSAVLDALFQRPQSVSPVSFGRGGAETCAWHPAARRSTAVDQDGSGVADAQPVVVSSPEALEWAAREVTLLQAIEDARAEGAAAAQAEAAAVIDAVQEQLTGALERLNDLARVLSQRYRQEAVELAVELARAVVGQAVEADPAALLVVVDRALQSVPRADEARIRCHPDDLDTVRGAVGEMTARRGDPIAVRVVASPAMERGGCIVDFDEGAVDARPSVALEVLREALESALAGYQGSPAALGVEEAPE